MSKPNIVPEKITSPMQLMASWFVMLILLTSVLLGAALNIEEPTWAAGYLVVFTSFLVLVVIGCVTLMLTKFRPHLQDSKEYAQWLKDKGQYSEGIIVKENKLNSSRTIQETNYVEFEPSSTSHYSEIYISNIYNSHKLLNALRDEGLDAEVYESNGELYPNPKDHESIWLGHRVSPAIASKAIKIALSIWPQLKYIQLSDYDSAPPDEVHEQIFLGGSTKTAKQRGLQEWTIDDFERINESMSRQELHAMIREKY